MHSRKNSADKNNNTPKGLIVKDNQVIAMTDKIVLPNVFPAVSRKKNIVNPDRELFNNAAIDNYGSV